MPTATSTGPVNAMTCGGESVEQYNEASQPTNGREARNLAEKQRRDKLNNSINELMKMVPHVADSSRRMDKSAVLRFATHGLRLQHVFGKSGLKRAKLQGCRKGMADALLNLLDSFFVTLTCHGQIVLISSSVEKLLGHCHYDLYGQNILQITHPEDVQRFKQQLIPTDLESFFRDSEESETDTKRANKPAKNEFQEDGGHDNSNNTKRMDDIDRKLNADRRSFTVRLARPVQKSSDKPTYEYVRIDGSFRRSDYSAADMGYSYPMATQIIRRSRSFTVPEGNCGDDPKAVEFYSVNGPWVPHDSLTQAALHGFSGNDIVLVAMGRLLLPNRIQRWSSALEANRLQYRTRHLIDGRIVECDQRISLVAGYLNEEVSEERRLFFQSI